MILDIYIVLVIVSLAALGIGLWQQKPYIVATGYVFLMLLGIPLYEGIEYKTGSVVTSTGATTTITNTYSTYQNTSIGIIFAIVFGWAFVLTLLEYRPGRQN